MLRRFLCWLGLHKMRLVHYTAEGYVYECDRCPEGAIQRRDGSWVP